MAVVTPEQFDAIPWQEVQSSNLERIAWTETGKDATDGFPVGELHVEFASSPGRAYRYANVPATLHQDFLNAASVGSFFANNIRGRFEHERVEAVEAGDGEA